MAEEPKKKNKSVGISTYARVRCFFKDRESLERACLAKSSAENNGGKGVLTTFADPAEGVRPMTTEFTDVLGTKTGNEDGFNIICMPLIESTLKGYKALLIAYGQTGSGKTFTLIGAKGPGQLGLLPRSIEYFLQCDKVLKVQMKAFEAYATTLTKIGIFDLFCEKNRFKFKPWVDVSDNRAENKAAEYKWVQKKSAAAQAMWKTKFSRTGFDTFKEGEVTDVPEVEDAFTQVELAHDASHFARTGKNPESSRGHTVYVVKLKITNPQGADYTPVTTEFIAVDLAGSEGGNTLDALPEGPAKVCRHLEGGVINYGLSQLKEMFAEMRKKGKLKKSQGNGLRKLLYPFVTANTMMSICFTLSPSKDNIMPTRATMKFAQDACKLKMKPIADTGSKDWKKAYEKIKIVLEEKIKLVEKYEQMVDAGIEQTGGSSGSGATDGHFKELLEHLLTDEQDHVIGLFRKYELMQYIDDKEVYKVKDAIEERKAAYAPKFQNIFKKYDRNKVGKENELMDEQIEKGVGIKNFYEHIADKHNVRVVHVKEAQQTSATLAHMKEGAQEDQKTNEWQQAAMELKAESRMSVRNANANMRNIEQRLNAGLMGDDMEEMYQPTNQYDIGDVGVDDAHVGDANVVFEELDMSQPPHFFTLLEDGAQDELHKAFDDDANFKNGQMTTYFRQQLTSTWSFTESQADDLQTYMMIRQGRMHDAEQVENFSQEIGGKAGLELVTDTGALQEMLELKNAVHQLENEKRVEQTMKLWESMRLRIRDRKLKKKELEVQKLSTKLEVLGEQIDKQGLGSSSDVVEKLDQIYSLMVKGGPEDEASGKLAAATQQIGQQEAEINALRGSLKDGSSAQLAKELSISRAECSRFSGRLSEIRHTMSNQLRMIDVLKQQIYIVLTFPKTLQVSGRSGFNASMNGSYKCGERLHGGRVYYKNEENEWVIRWYPSKGIWIFDWRGLMTDDIGGAVAHQDVQHPLLVATKWYCFDEKTNDFKIDQKIVLHSEFNMSKFKRGPR